MRYKEAFLLSLLYQIFQIWSIFTYSTPHLELATCQVLSLVKYSYGHI